MTFSNSPQEWTKNSYLPTLYFYTIFKFGHSMNYLQVWPILKNLPLQAPPPPSHRSQESISAAVSMKENNIQNNKENNVNLKANNDCIKGSGSLQKIRAATPQVSQSICWYIEPITSSGWSLPLYLTCLYVTRFLIVFINQFPHQGAPDGPLPPCPTSSPSLGAQEVNYGKLKSTHWKIVKFCG